MPALRPNPNGPGGRRFSFQRALQLLPLLTLDPLITDTVPLADYERAVALLRGGDAIKVVIQP